MPFISHPFFLSPTLRLSHSISSARPKMPTYPPPYRRVTLSQTPTPSSSATPLLPPVLKPPPPGISNSTPPLDPKVLFGEFLATFLFIYLSLNAAHSPSALTNSLSNAAIIAAIATSFIPVSGAHLNPAVTLALAITNRLPLKRALAFVPLQLVASVAATTLAKAMGVSVTFDGIAIGASAVHVLRAFVAELIPMFIIVVVVFQTAVATHEEGGVGNSIAGLYIGLAVLACAASFSTAVFNPARCFGPALAMGNFRQHWVYWAGPFAGACLAALICEHLFLAPASKRKPNSWLAAVQKRSAEMGSNIKNLGVAGIISYGVMNTLYYGVAFSFMMFKIGLTSGASGWAQAWFVTWSLSQVTKPLRLGLSIALAPFVDRFLKARKQHGKKPKP